MPARDFEVHLFLADEGLHPVAEQRLPVALQELLGDLVGVVVFVDDIVIGAHSREELLQRLGTVLEKLRGHPVRPASHVLESSAALGIEGDDDIGQLGIVRP